MACKDESKKRIHKTGGYKNEKITLPARATKFSAGYDFVSPLTFTLNPGETIKIPTGIRCGMNTDWVLMIYPRSGLGFKYGLNLMNQTGRGDNVVQGLFMEYGITEDDHVETFRNGGFGSTDKNKKE